MKKEEKDVETELASVSSSCLTQSRAAIKQVKFKIVCGGNQDVEVQVDLGFTGACLGDKNLMTTQKVDSMVQTEFDFGSQALVLVKRV